MKIALFHNVVSGGAKRAVYEYCRVLKYNGHRIDLFALNGIDSQFLPLDEFVEDRFIFAVGKCLPEYTDRSIKSIPRWLFAQKRLREIQSKMAETINNGGYDVCFVHLCVYTQAPYILRYLRIPSVYYCHEPLRVAYESPIERSSNSAMSFCRKLYTRYLAVGERTNVCGATLVVTNSFFNRESILRVYGLNSFVCYLGVDSAKFNPPEKKEKENTVLSVGAFHPNKGFRFLLRAISRIPLSERPGFIIIGDKRYYGEENALRDLADKLQVKLALHYNVKDKDLQTFYHKSKAFLYAPYLEPFGLSVLEAMSSGLAVAAVAEAGIRESVINGINGILVERDEDEFAAALAGLLKDGQSALDMGIRAREYVVKNWTWQKAYERLMKNFYKAINLYKQRHGDYK